MGEERRPDDKLSRQTSSRPALVTLRRRVRRSDAGGAQVAGLSAVGIALLAVFLVSVAVRAPWRGHLAAGDQWVTALSVRWARAWHRDGALATAFALVDSPPTREFAPPLRVRKWGLPGHPLLLHGIFTALGLEPTVARVMWVNLGLHLLVALQLAAVAYLLARWTDPDRPRRAAFVALHCGAFTLLFPVMLYWGQNLSVQDFSGLPLMIGVVVGRWLHADVGSRWRRVALDLGVAACVVLGLITEFLFWLLVPYLIATRLLGAWRGRVHTTDPWVMTLAVPYGLTMIVLLLLFMVQGYFEVMAGRAAAWVVGDPGATQGPLIGVRLFLVATFLRRHFSDAFHIPGFVALAIGAWWLLPRGRLPRLPARARGILIDLLLPCVLCTIALANHQANHTHAAMKYVPYVALAWTFVTPLVIGETRPRRLPLLRATYAVVAVLALLPFSSGYSEFFPAPQLRWEREGTFLRERSAPTDVVVSPTADIDMNPPQRVVLADRVVRHVYGPLDVLGRTTWMPPDTMVALYSARETYRAFGASGTTVVDDGEFFLVRFPIGQLRAFMQARPDADFRAHMGEVLLGGLQPTAEGLRPHQGRVRGPPLPVAMHTTDTRRFPLAGYDRLYWSSERRFHWKEFQQRRMPDQRTMATVHDREMMVLDDHRYAREWSLWEPIDTINDVPSEWGRFVLGLYDQVNGGQASTFRWRGYDVVLLAVRTVPRLLRAYAPGVAAWDAGLVFANGTPVALALGPARDHPRPAGPSFWVTVVFDDVVTPISTPEEIFHPWRIKSR